MGNCFVTSNKDQLTRIEKELSALQTSSERMFVEMLDKRVDVFEMDRLFTTLDRIAQLRIQRSLLNSKPEDEIVEEKKAFRKDQISRLNRLIRYYRSELWKKGINSEEKMDRCKTRLEELRKQKWILDKIRKNENRTYALLFCSTYV